MKLHILLMAGLVVVAAGCADSQSRKSKDDSRGSSIQETSAEQAGDQIVPKREDGKQVQMPLERFSAADQEYVREKAAAKPDDPSAVVEPTEPRADLASQRPASNKPDSEIREVIATGYGTTEEDAKANALQNAVQQAIGVLVDATTVVENDRLLTDKVLTYSNGYVERFKVLTGEKAKGLIVVKIAAQVKVQALSEKLHALSITMRQEVDGSSLAAVASTKGKRDRDAATMLTELFQGFPANCLALTTGTLRTGSADANRKTDLTVPVIVTVDPKRYQLFDTALRQLLSKMAIREKSYTLFPADLSIPKEQVESNKWDDNHHGHYQSGGVPLYAFLNVERGLSNMHFGTPGDNPVNTFGVALYDIDRSTARKSNWTVFELGKEHFEVFQTRCRSYKPRRPLNIIVRLLNEENKLLDEEHFLPIVDESRIVPRPGMIERPAVSLEGVRYDANRFRVNVSPDLMTLGLTEAGWGPSNMKSLVNGDKTYRGDIVPLFSIGPLFYYDFYINDAHAHSPELRLAVTFKEFDVDAVDKVRNVECSITLAEAVVGRTEE